MPPFTTHNVINRIKAERLDYFIPKANTDKTFLAAVMLYNANPLAVTVAIAIASTVLEANLQTQTLQADIRTPLRSKYSNLGPFAVLFMACLYYILPESLNPYSMTVWILPVILSIVGRGPRVNLAEPDLLKFVLVAVNSSAPFIAVSEVLKPIICGIVSVCLMVLWGLTECFSFGLGIVLRLVYVILVAALVSVSVLIGSITLWDWNSPVTDLVPGAGQNRFSDVSELMKRNLTATENFLSPVERSTIPGNVTSKAEEERSCSVCLEGCPDFAFVPCGHRVLCQTCSQRLVRDGHMTCIICRNLAEMIIKVYDN